MPKGFLEKVSKSKNQDTIPKAGESINKRRKPQKVIIETAKNPMGIIIQEKGRQQQEEKSDRAETEEHSKGMHACEFEGS